MPEVSDLSGLWTRTLLRTADGREDRLTSVFWLQGARLYADLRQPAGRPSLGLCRCLNDLGWDEIDWLSRQEGFAGRLERDGPFFVWRRWIDYQPKAGHADSGLLSLEGEVLVENGRYEPYLEHWKHSGGPKAPTAAARLQDEDTGAAGQIVRVGNVFMYARDRLGSVQNGMMEGARDKGVALEEARLMLDCEVSFGKVGAAAWTIRHSTLPFREGFHLCPELGIGERYRLSTLDVSADGVPFMRCWKVLELEGEACALADGRVT